MSNKNMIKISHNDWMNIGQTLLMNDPAEFVKQAEAAGMDKEAIGALLRGIGGAAKGVGNMVGGAVSGVKNMFGAGKAQLDAGYGGPDSAAAALVHMKKIEKLMGKALAVSGKSSKLAKIKNQLANVLKSATATVAQVQKMVEAEKSGATPAAGTTPAAPAAPAVVAPAVVAPAA